MAGSAQHHRGDGPTSSLGHVSMDKEQSIVCSGGLVVEVEAAVLFESRVGLKKQMMGESAFDDRRVDRSNGRGDLSGSSMASDSRQPLWASSGGCSETVGLGSKMHRPWGTGSALHASPKQWAVLVEEVPWVGGI